MCHYINLAPLPRRRIQITLLRSLQRIYMDYGPSHQSLPSHIMYRPTTVYSAATKLSTNIEKKNKTTKISRSQHSRHIRRHRPTWGTENAGLENAGPNRRGGKGRTGKRMTKFLGWKTHDHRLWNAKWVSIKTKGTLYDMYILLQI